jgi:hypothetical protein
MGVDKLLLALSYDNEYDRPYVYTKIRKEAMDETNKGREWNNHYIYSIGDEVKFLWQIQGVPIAAFTLINAFHSSAKDTVVVGNRLIGDLVETFVDEYGGDLKKADKRMRWVYDGERPSLTNTLMKGITALELKADEPYALVCGDVPLFYDYDDILHDPDIGKNAAVLDLNGFETVFAGETWPGHFPRYYHFRMDHTDVKEPNCHLLRNSQPLTGVVEKLYDQRKTTRSGGLKSLFFNRVLAAAPRIAPYLFLHEPTSLLALCAEEFRCVAASTRYEIRPFDAKVADWRPKSVSRMFSAALGAPVLIKVRTDDPGRPKDIDSAEDFMLVAETMRRSDDVYPHMQDLVRVASYVMPHMEHPIFNGFPSYCDGWCDEVGMPRLFHKGHHVDDFDARFPRYAGMIPVSVKKHLEFNDRRIRKKEKEQN